MFFLECLKYLIVDGTCEGLKFSALAKLFVAIDPGLVILTAIPVISGSHHDYFRIEPMLSLERVEERYIGKYSYPDCNLDVTCHRG